MPIKTELPSEETSEEESSDSDEEPTTKTPATVISTPQLKTFSVGIKQTPVVAAKTPLKSSQPADESSEEESTDSSEEPSVKKPATVHLSQPKTPSGGAKQASVLAKTQSPAKTTPLADESSEESDSEEESAAKKPATVHLSQPKTPSGGAKQASVLAKTQSPAKTTPLADDESSEESDSEEESAAKKPTTAVQSSQLKTPSGGAKQTTLKATLKTPLKTAQQDSESSEESDTDEETVAKKPATALQSTQPKSPSGDPKQTAMMAKSKTAEPNSESSDESDSDEEAAAKATPAVQVKMSAPDSSLLTVKQTFTVQVPDSDADSESSESSDTEQKQRSKSTAPVKVPKKTPAVVGKKVTKPAAADATDSSDSDDEEKAQPKPSAVSRGLKAKQSASTALKPDESSEESESESDEEPVKPAEVKTLETQKEKLSASQPKITAQPAAIVSKGKSLVSSKMTAFSQAMADSSESTESSDNEDLPPAQVPRISVKATPPAANVTVQPAAVAKHKAGGPTKSVPGTKLAKVDQGTPDGSESSDGEEQPDAQKLELSVEAKQKKKPMSAPLLTSTPYESTVSKGKAAVPASTHLVAKETDISESSDTESDEEETKQVVTPTPSFVKSKSGRITDTLAKTSTSSNPAIAKTTTPFKVPSTLKKDPVENSSESSDSESSEETAVKVNTPVPTAVKAAQPKVSEKLKTPNVTNPVPGKPNASSQQKPKQVDTDSSSESSDSEAEPVVKTAVQKVTTPGPTAKKMKQENQSDKVVRTPLAPKLLPSKPTGISVAKTPLQAGEESSSESSSSEEDTAEKPPPATPKPAAQPSVGKTTTQSPAVLQKKQESSSEESDSDEEEPVKKPTAATPKPAAQPTVRKTTTQSPAVLHKKQESSSEESDSDEKEPVKKLTSSFGKTQKKPEPAASLTKLKSPAKSTVVTKSNVSSDTASSDSEEDRPVQDKGAAPGNLASSNKSVERSVGKMSSADVKKIRPAVPSTPSGGSKPKDSQTLLKAFFPVVTTPKKRKKNSKTTNKLDSVAGKSKKKEAKNKVQPDIVPVLPMALPEQSPSAVALLESEEETVLALLEGRSPKKAKKNKISKKAAESAVFDFATPLVQNNDVPLKSPLPQPFLSSTWVPESPTSGDDKSVQPTTELLSLSDKKVKSSKKRKIFQDLEKQTQKPAKKAKKDEKEKKIQKGMVEEANVTAKPKSDKKKSEKDRSNKKTKTKEKMENKEGKKKAESIAAAVVESADSGIGLSKPKKKRKT
ncbi:nucleolar protein dao-5-like isoform X2 [Rana temporaria]|uniref:nucleolar protein dao-5-like isoform X2 n=1 Tax=Rana temporaria TaxID=8407 RepID=UPI001AACB15B|nr:nucleolar protein dao-5-like isoform X2 [Rana temporaria]